MHRSQPVSQKKNSVLNPTRPHSTGSISSRRPEVSPCPMLHRWSIIKKKALAKFVDIKAKLARWLHHRFMIDRTRAGRINYYSNLVLVIRALSLSHIILLLYYRLPSSGGWLTHVSGSGTVGVCSYYTRSVSAGWCTPPNQMVAGWAHRHRRGWWSRQAWRALVMRW